MKKKLLGITGLVVTIIVCFVAIKHLKKVENENLPQDVKIKNEIVRYYSKWPENKGELKIYNTKKMGDKYLVLTEKYSGDGHNYSDLFLLNSNFEIIKTTNGDMPMSMCISLNKIIYEDKTILFGNFNNQKASRDVSHIIDVDINKIEARLKNGSVFKDDVSINTGYIAILDGVADIEDIILYNAKGEVQNNIDDLNYYHNKDINKDTLINKEFSDYDRK